MNIYIGSNASVEVKSPGYPEVFPGGVDISWIIQAGEDRKIFVSFNNLNTKMEDNWNVGDGDVVGQSTILSWDDRQRRLPKLLSRGSTIWVSFFTSSATRTSFSFALTSAQSSGIKAQIILSFLFHILLTIKQGLILCLTYLK